MTNPFSRVTQDAEDDHEPTPEEGGSQSGSQIDESERDAPQDDHSPNTDNDIT